MSFFDFNKLTARLQAVLDENDENFSAKIFPRGRRSKLNNTYINRPTIVTDRDYAVKRKWFVGTKSHTKTYKLPAGSRIYSVQSMARGDGIDCVQKLIDRYPLPDGSKSNPDDWDKLKGKSCLVINKTLVVVELHFYCCRGMIIPNIKMKHLEQKLF